jgi:glycyl-tRNA synthetase beta subunit
MPAAVTTTVEEHYRPEALADRLSVSRATIFRALARGLSTAGRQGLWPVRRVGRATLIPASAVDAWLRRGH